jgi:hypothetical protein
MLSGTARDSRALTLGGNFRWHNLESATSNSNDGSFWIDQKCPNQRAREQDTRSDSDKERGDPESPLNQRPKNNWRQRGS